MTDVESFQSAFLWLSAVPVLGLWAVSALWSFFRSVAR